MLAYQDHYMVVKNESALLFTEKDKDKTYFCRNCLYKTTKKEILENHYRFCLNHEYINEIYPHPNKASLAFKKYQNMIKHPIVIYADFECYLEKIHIQRGDKTVLTQKHLPTGYGFYVCRFDQKNKYYFYTGENAGRHFMETLEQIAYQWYNEFETFIPLLEMEQADEAFKTTTHCYLCEKLFVDVEDYPVRDHCHYNGKFRGIAHNSCNLKVKEVEFIPIFFHNLSGYDERLFIRDLIISSGDISCIAKNEENFISFSKKIHCGENGQLELRFLDSYKFLATSLSNLVGNLPKGKCIHLKKEFPRKTQFELLLRKGVYPYSYIDSPDRLRESYLPHQYQFYNDLTKSSLSDQDYKHAHKVYTRFKCKTLKDYHDLYLKTDVLLLADVFENFREMALTHYQLDPVYSYTLPGFSWEAALKSSKVRLQLFSSEERDMYKMIEGGIRGGICNSIHRHVFANNREMKTYDPKQETSFILYLDANNLYGWAMSQPLPLDEFRWLDNQTDWQSFCEVEGQGCTLEVDLDYPIELHDLHKSYPCAPEGMYINGVEKLMTNLYHKRHYVVHYKALQLYLQLGLKLRKVHRILAYREYPWLKDYIQKNTTLRSQAKNDFEKDFFKMANNSVFGKTMENLRNRINILFGTNENFEKMVRKPTFKGRTILSEDLSLVNMRKCSTTFNKPIYAGQSILDLSKTMMYDFHYNYMVVKYKDKLKLCYTDTDSFVYHIKTEDVYRDIRDDVLERFDTSNYPENHILPRMNKKVVGLFKDECGGKQIREFICLKPKMYAFRMSESDEVKKACKGVPKVSINSLLLGHFRRCLYEGITLNSTSTIIRSHEHKMYTQDITKVSLSNKDDKRIILNDKVSTLPYGHWRIVKDKIKDNIQRHGLLTIPFPKEDSLCRKCLEILIR